MNAVAATSNTALQDYMNAVWAGLASMNSADKQDTFVEIKAHLSDRIEELRAQGSERPVEQALAALGDPSELAHQIVLAAKRRDDSYSYVPWVLLRAAKRIALTGVKGFLAFLIGVIGYSLTLAFLAGALVKPIAPGMGLWVGDWGIVYGFKPAGSLGQELLGSDFVYVSVVLAILFGSGSTFILQRLLRSIKRSPIPQPR